MVFVIVDKSVMEGFIKNRIFERRYEEGEEISRCLGEEYFM